MRKLDIPIYQGIKNKRIFLEEELFPIKKLDWDDIFYVGDYLNDFECLNRSRVSACPFDSNEIIKNIDGNMVLSSRGGDACVAEAIAWYLDIFDN
jgi:3-deoxy-D-manno-octulosonate 8-phosphate phosphatase KdsC-like HAD superfamily phosphatase